MTSTDRGLTPVECWICKGSGACPVCSGEGQVARSVPRASVNALSPPDYQVRDVSCSQCSASGICPRCGGKGVAVESAPQPRRRRSLLKAPRWLASCLRLVRGVRCWV